MDLQPKVIVWFIWQCEPARRVYTWQKYHNRTIFAAIFGWVTQTLVHACADNLIIRYETTVYQNVRST